METFWGDLLETHTARYDKNVQHAFTKSGSRSAIHLIHPLKEQIHHNRELYLSFIAAIVLNNARPSGYFNVTSDTVIDRCSSRGPLDAQPDDIVNYLACGCVQELLTPLEDEACITPSPSMNDDTFIYSPLSCLSVAFVMGIHLPLSAVYEEACKVWQLVPPRYQHYFPSSSHRLSDLDALRLLADCHPQLKMLEIFSPAFDKIAWGELPYQQEIVSGVLSRVFASVERVKLRMHAFGRNEQDPLAILTALLMNENPALSVLDIRELDKTVMKSLAPLLSAQPISTTLKSVWGTPFNVDRPQAPYCALNELRIDLPSSCNYILDDYTTVNALASIIECQSRLQVLTVANLRSESVFPRLYTALQSFCRRPTFHSLTLRGTTLPLEAAKSVVRSFLSSQCASDQGLTFNDVKLSHASILCMGIDPPLPEVPVCMPDCAQEHKSLTLRCTSQLATWLLHQKEVKLKSLTIHPLDRFGAQTQQRLLTLVAHHPSFHVQELILRFVAMDCTKDFEALLGNPSLKKLCIESETSQIAGMLKSAIEVKLGGLQELKLRIRTYLFPPSLFHDLFGLRQLCTISVSFLGFKGFPSSPFVEHMYKAWKEKSCPSLLNFAIDMNRTSLDDIQKAMLDEMCVQYLQCSDEICVLLKPTAV